MKRKSLCKTIFGLCLLAGCAGSALPSAAQDYTNSLSNAADPSVIYNPVDGYYYGSATGFYNKKAGLPNGSTGTLTVYRSTGLAELFNSTDTVKVSVTAGASAPGSPGTVTTPGLLAYGGQIYMYYRTSNGPTHVSVSPAGNPMGTWTDRNDLSFPGYDYDPFYRTATGQLYLFYVTTHLIHVQLMVTPLQPDTTHPQQVISQATNNTSSPEYRAWEHLDNANPPGANEAPQAFTLPVNGQPATYLTYSANTYQSDDYALGLLQYQNNDGTDQMDSPANWTKITPNNTPFLQLSTDDGHGNLTTGTGSNAIVADQNGKMWDVYDAYFYGASAANRALRMDPIAVDASGAPLIAQPPPSREGALISLPAGDPPTTFSFFAAGTYQYSDPRIYYSNVGGGQHAPWTVYTNQSQPYEGTNGLYADYMIQFSGRSVAVYGPTGQGFGPVSIYQDGTWIRDVDLSLPVGSGPIYVANYPTSGEHSLLVMTQPNPSIPTSAPPNGFSGLSDFTVSNNPLGDVNSDGVVSCTDFDLVKASFGQSRGKPGYSAAADLNGDGVVNIQDLSIVARNVPSGTVCR